MRQGVSSLDCISCGATYPGRNGTLDFVYPYIGRADLDRSDIDVVTDTIMATLALPASARTQLESAVIDSGLRTGVSHIDAEISSLASGFGIESDRPPALTAGSSEGTVKFAFIRHYVEPELPINARLLRTVRLQNLSGFQVKSDGTRAIMLSYHWLGSDGAVVVHEGARTEFPVPMDDGRTMSVVMNIDTPVEAGNYTLRVLPIEEGVRWNEENALDIPVTLLANAETELSDVVDNPQIETYGEDHVEGKEFIKRYLSSINFGWNRRFLEVAAGVHPQAGAFAEHGSIIVSSDICTNMCQIGRLYYDTLLPNIAGNVHFVSFDITRPPFDKNQFDAVVLFSALHHFPEPEVFLRLLVDQVNQDGFIAVLCEPCGPEPANPTYRRDLAQGINEQWFTLEEYNGIFSKAGLRPVATQRDGGSLKVILKRAER